LLKLSVGETVRKLRVLLLLALGIFVYALTFSGCSGSSATTITLSPASGQTLNPGQTVTITATVANDKNNQGVNWSLSGSGSLSAITTTSVVYTAPIGLAATTTATITATSVSSASVTATETITVNAVLAITTTLLPSGTQGVPYSAFVNAEGATGTFTWAVTSGSLPAGLTFLTTSTTSSAEISGTPTVLGTSKFTVQVTDAVGASVSQPLSITINQPPPLSVATGSLPAGTVGTLYSQTLQASSGVPPYTWSITAGSLPIGLNPLASNGVISGTPIATGTYNFTVEVVDSSMPAAQTATANLSITVNLGITDNSKLHGNYAFSIRGFDTNGLFVAAGSFVADGNGNISNGSMDINDTRAGGLPVTETFSGTYSIGQDGLGYMTFNILTGGTGSRSFTFSMGASGSANIIEFDDTGGFINNTARNSGVLKPQDTGAFNTGSILNNYAFGFLGIDSSKNRFGVAGDLYADGAGNFTSGLLDSDDAISGLSSSVAFTGTYSAIASSGRGQATIKTAQATTVYSFYVVNSGELFVVGIDPFTAGGNPLVGGEILQQTSGSDLTAASVFEVTALNASTPESQVGQLQASTGTFGLTSDENVGGALSQPTGSGTYSTTSGRVTLSGTGFLNSPPVLYMVSDNEAFIIGTDPAVSFGFMTQQSSGFSLSGTYAGGSLAPVDAAVSNVVSIAIAGSNTIIVTSDVSNQTGLSFLNQVSEATTPPDSHGRVVVTETTNTTQILYLVPPAQFFGLSTDATARVDIFQH